jgi:hypothetical protein
LLRTTILSSIFLEYDASSRFSSCFGETCFVRISLVYRTHDVFSLSTAFAFSQRAKNQRTKGNKHNYYKYIKENASSAAPRGRAGRRGDISLERATVATSIIVILGRLLRD